MLSVETASSTRDAQTSKPVAQSVPEHCHAQQRQPEPVAARELRRRHPRQQIPVPGGTRDRVGRELLVTQPASADQLAAAAGLLMWKSAGIPVVVIEGFPIEGDGGVQDFLRESVTDLFR